MNDPLNQPNLVPPVIPVPSSLPTAPRLVGDDPSDCLPIPHAFAAIDAILRHPRRIMFQLRQPAAGRLIFHMLAVTLFCSLVYGVVVGTFSHDSQLWIAPVKIALGLLISALICLPSLYIFTCLSGSQARLIEITGYLAGLLMLLTVLLTGFAPVAWVFSQSTNSLPWMGALHLIFWFVATIFGLRFLAAGFSQSAARSHAGFNTWVVIFLLVAVQMTTALRPIIGKADTFLPVEKKFFLTHWSDCIKADDQGTKARARD